MGSPDTRNADRAAGAGTALRLAVRMGRVSGSLTLEMDMRGRELRESGKDVVVLAAGEPDFDAPDHVKAAAEEAIRAGRGKYTAVAGTLELREAIARKLETENGLLYAPHSITVTSGAKQAIYNALAVLVDPGDEVVIPAPYWTSYPQMVNAVDGVPVFVPTRAEDGYDLDPDAIARALTPRSKLLVINSPNNPTGAVYTRERLAALAAVVRARPGLAVLTDDIYEKLCFDGRHFVSILDVAPDLKDRTIVVNGLSKAYCMTGWRIGYAAGPRHVIAAMNVLQGHTTSNANSIAQAAAVAALTGDATFIDRMRETFSHRREVMLKGLREIPGITCPEPHGAFYLLPDVSRYLSPTVPGSPRTSYELSMSLLETALVAVVPGEAFGAPGTLRISYASSRVRLNEGLARMRDFLAKLPHS